MSTRTPDASFQRVQKLPSSCSDGVRTAGMTDRYGFGGMNGGIYPTGVGISPCDQKTPRKMRLETLVAQGSIFKIRVAKKLLNNTAALTKSLEGSGIDPCWPASC